MFLKRLRMKKQLKKFILFSTIDTSKLVDKI